MINQIILAGGSGKRIKHLTGVSKQFFILPNGLSSFMLTIKRALVLSSPENIVIVININHLEIAHKQLSMISANITILVEPISNNTMSAVLFGLYYFSQSNLKTLVVPCDHIIENIENYQSDIKSAINLNNPIHIFGAKNTEINLQYGHIIIENKKIIDFIEKPLKQIEQEYLWNSGIFLLNTPFVIELLEEYLKISKKINFSLEKIFFLDTILYDNLSNIPFDLLLTQNIQYISVSCINFDWLDIGSSEKFNHIVNLLSSSRGFVAQLVRAYA